MAPNGERALSARHKTPFFLVALRCPVKQSRRTLKLYMSLLYYTQHGHKWHKWHNIQPFLMIFFWEFTLYLRSPLPLLFCFAIIIFFLFCPVEIWLTVEQRTRWLYDRFMIAMQLQLVTLSPFSEFQEPEPLSRLFRELYAFIPCLPPVCVLIYHISIYNT